MATPSPQSPLLLWLGAVGRKDVDVAGGKGANLGELVRVGFPVPPGFLLTTAAYERFVAENQLREAIEKARLDEADAAGTRAAFEGGRMPGPIESALAEAYSQLGGAA